MIATLYKYNMVIMKKITLKANHKVKVFNADS